uniref:CCHC-type domain-containing protein n=1 Tax=Setaria italica TaxID=4555 RepID=K4AKE2_SETIT
CAGCHLPHVCPPCATRSARRGFDLHSAQWYSAMVTSSAQWILHDSSNLTMARALSKLIAEETRLRSTSVASMSVSHSTSSEPCKHCGKTSHTAENCFSEHPEKLAEFRARRAARAARGRGTTLTPRGSMSVAATSPSVNDGASIQTTDGTSCSITHEGSSNWDYAWD